MSPTNKVFFFVLWMAVFHQWFLPSQGHKDVWTKWDFRMPAVLTTEPDQYICTAMALNSSMEQWLVSFEPLATADVVHHMVLYGCGEVPQTTGYWKCGHEGTCKRSRPIFTWGRNAAGIVLPSGVGFRVGGSDDDQYLTLQIHYVSPMPDKADHSGVRIQVTTERQPYTAGMMMVYSGTRPLPANTERTYSNAACQLAYSKLRDDIHIFAGRVHTHRLGTVIKAYKYDIKTREYELMMEGNPQWPQAFNPREEVMTLTPRDVVAMRCTYNTTGKEEQTAFGRTYDNEMCVGFLLYFTQPGRPYEKVFCGGVHVHDVIENLPEGNDEPLRPNTDLEAKSHGYTTDKGPMITFPPVVSPSPAGRTIEKD